MLSRAAEVALLALPEMDPAGPTGKGVLIATLAERAHVPRPFLAKVLQRLADKGLLRSKKGRMGGFLLGRPAWEITVADIVLALDGADSLEKAFPSLAGPVGDVLHPVRTKFLTLLAESTLADLYNRR